MVFAKIVSKRVNKCYTLIGGIIMKYLCLVCGVEFESDDENPVCPVCGATGSDLEVIDSEEK